MRGPETRLYKRIKKAILEKYPGSLLNKIHGNMFQNVGIQDLVGCLRVSKTECGIYLAIEVKIPGKNASPAQDEMIRKTKLAGGITGVAHSITEAFAIIESGLKARRK